MNTTGQLQPGLERMRQGSLTVGAVALAACLAAGSHNSETLWHSYLFAFVFWTGAGLGSMAILMLQHLVGGTWGFALRRALEAGTKTLLWMAALAVPLIFFFYVPYLKSLAGEDPLSPFQRVYLSSPFFIARAAIYFGAWIAMAHYLNKWSLEQDQTADPSLSRRLQILSGPGLVVYGLTATYASVDWVMSLEPRWFSTIYGMIFMVTQALTAMALVTVVAALLRNQKPLSNILSPLLFNDFGNLLLTFTMLWAYLSFSQYLIIWSGNLPEEIQWYTSRAFGGWAWVAVALIVFHFAAPFVLLLMRFIKRNARVMAVVAVALAVMSAVDIFWLTVPAYERDGPKFIWTDWAAFIGIGGVWLWSFTTSLKGKPLLPLGDPRLEGAPAHE